MTIPFFPELFAFQLYTNHFYFDSKETEQRYN